MDQRLNGRVAVVTGGGNGVGKACARSLAAHGASVVVNDLGTSETAEGSDTSAADTTVAEIRAQGGSAVANYDSVATAEGVDSLVATATSEFGPVDIVVACAGAVLPAGLETDDETYRRFVDLFLSQKFWLARAVVPGMAERGWGRLVFTTSHGAMGNLGQPVFAATMGGVVSLTKAIAQEQRGAGVTANCLAPGAATRLHALSADRFEQLWRDELISDDEYQDYLNTPPPEYVAPIVTWLCGESAADVTGEVFFAAGGTVSVWSHYRDERTIFRGDHRTNPPWDVQDLDRLVHRNLFMS